MSADRRDSEQKPDRLKELIAAVRAHVIRPVWDLIARRAWCRRQRRELRLPGRAVLWVRGDTLPWAEWGGRHGYFDVERMSGLAYLRAVGAPIE